MRKFGLLVCAMALLVPVAFGDTVSFTTAAGSNIGGISVAGTMTITYAGSNTLQITVTNLTNDPSNQTQIITGLELSTSGALSGASMTGSAGQTRDLDGTGNFVYSCSSGPGCNLGLAQNGSGATGTTTTTNWALSSSFYSGGLALCAAGCGTWHPEGIIGNSNAGNSDSISAPLGIYDQANPSITNAQHSPEVYGPVTFTVSAGNIDALTNNGNNIASLVTGANFVFGTSGSTLGLTGGCSLGCGPPPPAVPEPGSLLLFGTGLCGLAGLFRRKILR